MSLAGLFAWNVLDEMGIGRVAVANLLAAAVFTAPVTTTRRRSDWPSGPGSSESESTMQRPRTSATVAPMVSAPMPVLLSGSFGPTPQSRMSGVCGGPPDACCSSFDAHADSANPATRGNHRGHRDLSALCDLGGESAVLSVPLLSLPAQRGE